MKTFNILLFMLVGSQALGQSAILREGSEGIGGGDVFVCQESGEEKVYLADTYELVKAGKAKGIEKVEPQVVVEATVRMLESLRPQKDIPHPFKKGKRVSLGWMIKHTYINLNFHYETEPMIELDDDNIDPVSIPANCKKVQLAVQLVGKNIVNLNLPLESKLSMIEQSFFHLHETFIALRNAPGDDTTPIRQAIAAILADPTFSFKNVLAKLVRREPHPETPKPSLSSRYVEENCTGPAVDINDPVAVAKKAVCDKARWIRELDWRIADRKATLPTLLKIPEKMKCRIMAETNNDLYWYPTTDFTISDAGKTITFDDDQEVNNGSADLITHRHEPQGGFERFGGMRATMMWSYPSGPQVILHEYHARTGEFIGVLQKSGLPRPGGQNELDRYYTSFSISCDSPKVEIGIDMKNSHY